MEPNTHRRRHVVTGHRAVMLRRVWLASVAVAATVAATVLLFIHPRTAVRLLWWVRDVTEEHRQLGIDGRGRTTR